MRVPINPVGGALGNFAFSSPAPCSTSSGTSPKWRYERPALTFLISGTRSYPQPLHLKLHGAWYSIAMRLIKDKAQSVSVTGAFCVSAWNKGSDAILVQLTHSAPISLA